MTNEQLAKLLTDEMLLECIGEGWRKYNRLKINRIMYIVYTPRYVRLWHRITGKKPYLDFNYQPKI
jgi:hypothetical protein